MKYQAPFGSPDPNAGYVDKNVPGAVAGSKVPAKAVEQPQRELLYVLTQAGLVPSDNDLTQLWQALNLMLLPGFAGRLAWMPVLSVTTIVPPGAPVMGDAYIVPAGAAGAWAGNSQKLAIWTGSSWALIQTKDGHGVCLPDSRLFVRAAGIYIEFFATDTRAGLVKTATTQDVKDAVGTGVVRAQDLASYILRPDTATLTLYVRPDGNDLNDGSANDAAHAFKTLAAAVDRIQNRYAFAGRKAILKLGTPGTYDTVSINSVAGAIEITGDKANRSGYVLTGTRGVTIVASTVSLIGLSLTYGVGAVQHNLQVGKAGVATIDGVIFNGSAQATWSHMFATDSGGIVLQSGLAAEVRSDAYAALYAATGGTIAASTGAQMLITSNNPSFADATAVARTGGVIEIAALTFQAGGGGLGRRYHASLNGVINTNNSGPNFIPGNSAGLIETGGQYA
ncbi:DUF2793 domain-containing protein [Mesorhizobium sp. 1M-11]|uniref:DUF2793 domain-containing protein n=1 Tax=Mesorhizobium sp. 1M-11 TaxID=1529006 RepID=UPI0006C77012|nr:DUF2793 domain-containing protein [Mesorhizobium sp. 1M-11]